jgi:hypothetical protein
VGIPNGDGHALERGSLGQGDPTTRPPLHRSREVAVALYFYSVLTVLSLVLHLGRRIQITIERVGGSAPLPPDFDPDRRAPGAGLLVFAMLVFGKKAHDRIFSQVVGDARDDIFCALQRGRVAEAQFAHLRMYLVFGRTVVFHIGSSVVAKVLGLIGKRIRSGS